MFSFKIRVNIFFYQTQLLEIINFYIEHVLLQKLKLSFTDLITANMFFYAFNLDFSHLNGICVVQEETKQTFFTIQHSNKNNDYYTTNLNSNVFLKHSITQDENIFPAFYSSSLLSRSSFRSHNNWSGRAGNAFSSIGKTSSTTDFITNPFNGTVRNSYQNLINSTYFILRYISACNSCSYGRMVYLHT